MKKYLTDNILIIVGLSLFVLALFVIILIHRTNNSDIKDSVKKCVKENDIFMKDSQYRDIISNFEDSNYVIRNGKIISIKDLCLDPDLNK